MGSEFTTYLRLGLSHIADLQGYDHILFIVALTAGFGLRDWKRLLWLVTAFTLGHSVTLALATLNVIHARSALIEMLIAVTIVIAGVFGLVSQWRGSEEANAGRRQRILYVMAGGFGLIHGLGFSNFLRAVLGGEESIVFPLLAFNVGLEGGQLLIVGVVLLLGALVCEGAGLRRKTWAMGLSFICALFGARMMWERMS
ncbi:MAG: HupE/UreJ family protein [Gemmatimonadaceae bacterium]